MFKTVKQLQDFILWAKAQKIREVHVGKIVVVFSEFALAEAMADSTLDDLHAPKPKTEERNTSKTILDEPGDEPDNDEELLFHSSKY